MRKECRRDSGQAMAEFALTALFFFMLVLMLLDGGRILWHYVSVSEGARDAARYAITHGQRSNDPLTMGNYTSDLGAVIRQRAPNLNAANLTILPPVWEDGIGDPGTRVTITLSYRVKPITGIVFRPNVIQLRSSSSMTVQN